MRVENIKLELIVTNAGTQTRASINEEVVKDYADAMKKGDVFPAVIVFSDGNKYLLADGFHRLAAAKLNGVTEILAEIHEGSRTDALKFGFKANDAHGQRRTSADKRNCVVITLKEFPGLSNRAIADQCGVSDMLVKDVREEQVPESGTSIRIGKNGKKFDMKKKAARRAKTVHKQGAGVQVRQVRGWFTKAKPEARGVLVTSIFTLGRPVVVQSKAVLKKQFGSWLSKRVKEQHAAN